MTERYTHRQEAAPDDTNGGALVRQRLIIQPNLSVRGWPCSAGSHALDGYHALVDATLIQRLRQSGARLVGSSRMAELGLGLAGDTTAQLLADGEADLALIIDTLGEARVAAAGTGLYGFKPSHGRVSRHGLVGLAPSLECPGILARHPDRILNALTAMAGPDPDDPAMPDDCRGNDFEHKIIDTPSMRTAGVITQSMAALTEQPRALFETALGRLAAAGVSLRAIDLPEWNLCRDTHQAIAAVEASSSAGKFDGVRYGYRAAAKQWNEMYLETRKAAFGPLLKSFLFQGAYFQFNNYAAFDRACRLRRKLVVAVARCLEQVELLVAPTQPPGSDAAAATTIAATYDAFAFTLPANLTGQPALHLPGAHPATENGPGLQLIGRRLDDARLLDLAARMATLEQEGR